MYKPVVLIVLDGWGISESTNGNAIANANLPTITKLNKFYPHMQIQASGISVGLPWGEPGNSEVGHITMGTGKIIYQNMPRITIAIQNGEFFSNPEILEAIGHVKKNDSKLHIMGLVGKGAVHSYNDHLYALLQMSLDNGIKNPYLHLFTDGRDSPPTAGVSTIKEIQKKISEIGAGKIATLSGRFFAMDRNNNWDRVEKAYLAITQGNGEKIDDPIRYLEESYKNEVTDEYLKPAVMIEKGQPVATVGENDAVIFFNFREDRARQITKAFVLPGFDKFPRETIKNLNFTTFVQYEEGLPASVSYKPILIKECLGHIISSKGLRQLRIAETEKFAHVTYFFNGGEEDVFPKEDRMIVPSPVNISSFDQAPQMSARDITEKVLLSLEKDAYDFILINYANADIVGHTGNEKATIIGVETIDECLGKLIPAVLEKNGCLLITSDHGNAEEVKNVHTGEIDTEHSTNPVPLWYINPENHHEREEEEAKMKIEGMLSDIAPTVLDILGIEKPKEMTGESLLLSLK
jgi:2,3-bisphosphoglycerate-independent phosphoglycerate mutase